MQDILLAAHKAVVSFHTASELHATIARRLHEDHMTGRTLRPEHLRLTHLLSACKKTNKWSVQAYLLYTHYSFTAMSQERKCIANYRKLHCVVNSVGYYKFIIIRFLKRKQMIMEVQYCNLHLYKQWCLFCLFHIRIVMGEIWSYFGYYIPSPLRQVEFHPASIMAEHGKWRFMACQLAVLD